MIVWVASPRKKKLQSHFVGSLCVTALLFLNDTHHSVGCTTTHRAANHVASALLLNVKKQPVFARHLRKIFSINKRTKQTEEKFEGTGHRRKLENILNILRYYIVIGCYQIGMFRY